MSETVSGQCLCGAVRISAPAVASHLEACHCTMCRQWGGGPLIVVHCRDEMQVHGEEFVTRYRSSEWAERGFCSRCGSHLFYRLVDGRLAAIPAGLVTLPEDWTLATEVYVEEQPAYYRFLNDTRRVEGDELFD